MSRLAAWIASRRQLRRSAPAQAANACPGRRLRFERCEERIALSTNDAITFAPAANFGSIRDLVAANEGGLITVVAGDSALRASSAGAWDRTNTFGGGATYLFFDGSISLGTSLLDTAFNGTSLLDTAFNGFDGDAMSPELMLTDTRVVPIPPPEAGQGGHEGGQISMTAFMGPATLGLPSTGDSLYAAKARPALRPEGFEAATDNSNPAAVESLRGRAVVYEVAHVDDRLSGANDRLAAVDASRTELQRETAWNDAQISNHNSRHEGSAEIDRDASSSRPTPPAYASGDQLRRRHGADAIIEIEAATHSLEAARALDAGQESSVAATPTSDAAAHDAAFARWRRELEPALTGREVAAATADSHQRRILGAALIVLGAIPVTKALRRHAHQESIEVRPRKRSHSDCS